MAELIDYAPDVITEKKFRWTLIGGYKRADVQSHLEHMGREWEHMLARKTDLENQLEKEKQEVERLKKVEESLLERLSDFSKTRQKMLDEAAKEAQLVVARGQMKADKIVEEAEKRSRMMLEDANVKYRDRLEALRKKISHMEHIARSADEHALMFIQDITRIIESTTERIALLSNARKQAPWLTDESGREAKEEEPAVRVVSDFGKPKPQPAAAADKPVAAEGAPTVLPPPGLRNQPSRTTATAPPPVRQERTSSDEPTWHFDTLI